MLSTFAFGWAILIFAGCTKDYKPVVFLLSFVGTRQRNDKPSIRMLMRHFLSWPIVFAVACAQQADQTGHLEVREVLEEGLIDQEPHASLDAPFRVGIAVNEIPAPVGIPTAGYGQIKNISQPRSPFADMFAATRRVHTPPLVKAIAFCRGGEVLVVARLDLIGIFGPFLDEVLKRLKRNYGVDLTGRLIISCTHTHAGPGRLSDHPVVTFAADSFFPEYFDRVLDVVTATVAQSLDSLEDAVLGVVQTKNSEAHVDRRCENPLLRDDTLSILAVRAKDQNGLLAVLVNYAVHGTVLVWQDYTLSRDAPGAIEDKVREELAARGFGAPEVLFLQGAAGDAGPASFEAPVAAEIPPKWTSLEILGHNVAKSVAQALSSVPWAESPELSVASVRLRLDLETLGYSEEEFPYPHGAIYCGFGKSKCYEEPGQPPDMSCLSLSEDAMVHQAELTLARLGSAIFATMPGEPHAEIGLALREALVALDPKSAPFVLGYSQAYLGYIMRKEDWQNGGYEPTLGIWGYRFADYLIRAHAALFSSLLDPAFAFPYETETPIDWSMPKYTARNPEVSAVGPAFLEKPKPQYGVGETIVVKFAGGDPWLGTPVVIVEAAKNGEYAPYQVVPGVPLTSLLAYVTVELEVSPTYEEVLDASERTFLWTARVPTVRAIITQGFPLKGRFRIKVEGFVVTPQKNTKKFTLITEEFEVK